MEILQKKYRKKKLDFTIAIVKKNLADRSIVLDQKIEQLVHLLYVYGFNPIMSCEGHVPPYRGVDTFRLFWPYVQLIINNKVVFDLEKKDDKGRMQIQAELDHYSVLQKLETLIIEFNLTKHPFAEKHSELGIMHTGTNSSIASPYDIRVAIEKHYNLRVMICDIGVPGILVAPQELLNDTLRKKFLERTQRQMVLFGKFLKWNYVENGL